MKVSGFLCPWPKTDGLWGVYWGIAILGVIALGVSNLPIMIFWISLVFITIYLAPSPHRIEALGVQDDRWCVIMAGTRYCARLKASSVRMTWLLALEFEVEAVESKPLKPLKPLHIQLCMTRWVLGKAAFTQLSRMLTVIA